MKNGLHFVLVAALLSAACGDSGEVAQTTAPTPVPDREEIEVPTPEGYKYVIDPADALPLDANALTSTQIRVVLRDTETRMPVAQEMLGFELVTSADNFTSLNATTAVSDTEGLASVDLRFGPTPGTAMVEVSHPEAEVLEIPIHIGDPLLGTIRVDIVEPTTTQEIAPFRISVLPLDEFGCNEFIPRRRLPTTLRQVHTADSQPVDIEGFDSGEYTVVAEAIGAGGLVLAGGCVDFVDVTYDMTTAVTVPLEMFPISPSGTYEVNGEWDIAEAVRTSNDTAGTLVGVIEFMANPGQSIYDLVLTELEDAIDFDIGILLGFTGLEQQVVTLINDALFQFAPIQTFAAVANDLNNMLHHLQVTSILTIEKTDTDWQFVGHEVWNTLTVDWTWRCQQNPTQNCQQYIVDLQSTGAAAVEYDWEGYVDGYDQLVVGSHDVTFDVGRLQMYLLEQVIIPDLTGGNANSLAGALSYWVDCPGLAAQALGNNDICDPTGTLCVGQTLIEGACNAAMTEVADAVLGPIQGQDVIADMTLDGKATLIDLTPNGIADELHDGVTEGVLTNSTEPVTATWTAVRITDPTQTP